MYKSYPRLDNITVKAPYVPIVCKHCGSHNVIRYGTYHGNQRFWCKDCERKFADNDALPEMQTPVEQIGTAIGMFYEGQSLNSFGEEPTTAGGDLRVSGAAKHSTHGQKAVCSQRYAHMLAE